MGNFLTRVYTGGSLQVIAASIVSNAVPFTVEPAVAEAPPPVWFVAEDGNDANDGTSEGTAFASLTQLFSVMSDEDSVQLKRGSRFAPTTNEQNGLSGKWSSYGDTADHAPFVDCSLPVTNGDIAPHGTHANVYTVDITHAVAPYFVTSNQTTNGPHVGLWWETTNSGILGEYLEAYFDGADIAAGEQFVKDNPGRCFVYKVGSTEPDVRNETTATTLRYVFQLPDASDPRGNGAMRYACYHTTGLNFVAGADVDGLIFGRNTRKDCIKGVVDGAQQTVALPVFKNCAWMDPGCHAVVGMCNWRTNIAFSRTPGSPSGGGWHNFTSVYDARVPDAQDSHIEGFSHAVYSHGSAQVGAVLGSLSGRRLRIKDCANGFSMPIMDSYATFTDIELQDVTYVASAFVDLSRFKAYLVPRSGESGLLGYDGAILSDGVIEYSPDALATGNYICAFPNAFDDYAGAAALEPQIYRRLTLINSPDRYNKQQTLNPYFDARFEDSVIRRTAFSNNTGDAAFLELATMTNCYIGPVGNGGAATFGSLAAYQAVVPGAASDVVLTDAANAIVFSAGVPFDDPTITGPAAVVSQGMGVDPAIITALPTTLANVPTLVTAGLRPANYVPPNNNPVELPNLIPHPNDLTVNNGTSERWFIAGGSPTVTYGETAYDASATASRITATAAQDTKIEYQSTAIADATQYTFAVVAKREAGSGWLFLLLSGPFGSNATWFDLNTGAVGTEGSFVDSSSVVDLGGGWYRLILTITSNAAGTSNLRIEPCTANGASTAANGDSIDICRVQAHEGGSAGAIIDPA